MNPGTRAGEVALNRVNRFVTGPLWSRPIELQSILMSFTRPFRTFRCAVVPCLVTGLMSACATRSPETTLQAAPVASSISWRIEEGDVITTRVYRNPELGSQPTVGRDGSAFFPGLGRIAVVGMTLDSLESLLNARYGSTVIKDAVVQVTMQRDLLAEVGRVPFAAKRELAMHGIIPTDPNREPVVGNGKKPRSFDRRQVGAFKVWIELRDVQQERSGREIDCRERRKRLPTGRCLRVRWRSDHSEQ